MAAAEAANATSCDLPAKIRIGSPNRAKETAADIGKLVKGRPDATSAVNCARLASTRISWANRVKEIAEGTARLAEADNESDGHGTKQSH